MAVLMIGDIIRTKRKAKRMTQSELAIKLGTNQATVCSWEIGQNYPTALYLCDLADAFECSVDELLGRTQSAEKGGEK